MSDNGVPKHSRTPWKCLCFPGSLPEGGKQLLAICSLGLFSILCYALALRGQFGCILSIERKSTVFWLRCCHIFILFGIFPARFGHTEQIINESDKRGKVRKKSQGFEAQHTAGRQERQQEALREEEDCCLGYRRQGHNHALCPQYVANFQYY